MTKKERRIMAKTRADYKKEITERTQAAKELVLNQSKSADGLTEYGAFAARFAGKGSANVKLIYEQNAQAQQVITKKELETNNLSLASEQEQPLRIFEAKKIETFLTETNRYVPIYKATDEQKKLIDNGTLKKSEKTYYNLIDAYDIQQLDKESQEKIRQEGTKASVELEPVIHAYVEKQYATMKNGTFQKAFTEYIVRQHYGLDQTEELKVKFENWATRDSPDEYRLKTMDNSQKNASVIIQSLNKEMEGEKEVKQTIKKDRVTKQEIAAAEKVSILDIAQQNGIDLEQSAANEFRFVHDHSVVINTRKNIYNDFATSGRGGNTIHFVQKELNVKNFVQAVKYINSGEFIELGDFTDKPVPYEYNPSKETQDFTDSKNYLVNERKINPDLVDHLHKEGLLRQTQYQSEAMKEKGYAPHNNLVMAWKYENQIVGATEQGVQKNEHYKRGAFKGVQEYSQINRGFNFKFGEPKHLYCFESGIDAMSFASLQIENEGKGAVKDSWYVSMEGLKSNALGEHIRLAYDELNKNKAPEEPALIPAIELCIDNDEAADKFYKNLPFNKDTIVRNSPELPEGKEKWDWNDQLKSEKENEIEVNPRVLEMYPSVKDIQAALVFDKYGDLREYQTNEKLFLKLPTELSRQIEALGGEHESIQFWISTSDEMEGRAEAFERRDEIKQQIQEITEPIIQQSFEKDSLEVNPEMLLRYSNEKDLMSGVAIDKHGEFRDHRTNEKIFSHVPEELAEKFEELGSQYNGLQSILNDGELVIGEDEILDRLSEIKGLLYEATAPAIKDAYEKSSDNKQTNLERTKEQNVQRKHAQQIAIER